MALMLWATERRRRHADLSSTSLDIMECARSMTSSTKPTCRLSQPQSCRTRDASSRVIRELRTSPE